MLTKLEAKQAELVLLHDETELEIPRPTDSDLQKEKYSGKKKKHMVKNAVVICATCMILFVSQTVAGTMRDKKMADTLSDFTVRCALYQDTCYQGYKPANVNIVLPIKKMKGKELSQEKKEYNRKNILFQS